MSKLDIYDHVRKYWDIIDRNSLISFIQVTEKRDKEYRELIELCEKDQSIYILFEDLLPNYKENVKLRDEAIKIVC